MGRLFRRLAVFTVIGVAAAAVFRRFFGGGECGPACDCSLGEPEAIDEDVAEDIGDDAADDLHEVNGGDVVVGSSAPVES